MFARQTDCWHCQSPQHWKELFLHACSCGGFNLAAITNTFYQAWKNLFVSSNWLLFFWHQGFKLTNVQGSTYNFSSFLNWLIDKFSLYHRHFLTRNCFLQPVDSQINYSSRYPWRLATVIKKIHSLKSKYIYTHIMIVFINMGNESLKLCSNTQLIDYTSIWHLMPNILLICMRRDMNIAPC